MVLTLQWQWLVWKLAYGLGYHLEILTNTTENLISDNPDEFRSEFLRVLMETKQLMVVARLSDTRTALSGLETCSSKWIFKESSAADFHETYCTPNLMTYHLGQHTVCTWFSCIVAFFNPSTKFLDGSLNVSRNLLKSRIKISGFRRGVHEICALLGFYAALNCILLPTFWDNPSVSSFSVKQPKNNSWAVWNR